MLKISRDIDDYDRSKKGKILIAFGNIIVVVHINKNC